MKKTIILLLLLMAAPLWAESRSLNLGLSYNYLLEQPFAETGQHAPGFAFSYNFIVKENFHLGISTALRRFGGQNRLWQLGYGLLLKHYLWYSAEHSWHPYLSYGLLLSVSSQRNASGTGTAHDTRLTAGLDFELFSQLWFFEASYNFSRLRFFDTDSINLDYFEAMLGLQFRW